MKTYFLFLLLLLTLSLCKFSLAQVPGLDWARNVGGVTSKVQGISMATDLSGNVYSTGYFNGTADFDPGAGTFELTANDNDGFVSKVDANGNFIWAIQFGAALFDSGTSITIDAAGNVLVAGYFAETVIFDPGVTDFELTSLGGWDGVILKLTPNGNFVLAKQLGGVDNDYINGIRTDASNNIYTTGSFNDVADFDPDDVTTFELISAGATDVFVSKLDGGGNFVWALPFGNTAEDSGVSLTIDISENVYVTGRYEDAVTAGNYEIFVNKLDKDGNPIWNEEIGGASFNTVHTIRTDALGNIYISGTFSGTVDFDPQGTVFNLTGPDTYLCKLSSSGGLIWAKALGFSGANAAANSMSLDINGNIFLTGYFYETVDLDPGVGVAKLFTAASDDGNMFVLKLADTGDYVWAQAFGSPASIMGFNLPSSEQGNFVTTDSAGNIYILGLFSQSSLPGAIIFASGICATGELTAAGEDMFILKLAPSSIPGTCFGVINQPVSAVACQETPITISSIAAGTARITYQWQIFNGTTFVNISDQGFGDDDGEGNTLDGYGGTNSPYLTLQFVGGSGTQKFRCKVSGESVSDVFSDVATLTLQGSSDIPYVVANSGCGPGQFLISAFGGADGSYQWYDQTGNAIAGQVNSTYRTPLTSSPTKYSVTKGTGGCISSPVEVEVNTNACAPVPGLVWASQPKVSSGSSVQIGEIDIDASGNIYAVGYFTGTVDFDPGPGTSILSTAIATKREDFVLKLTRSRDLVWVKSLNDRNYSISTKMSLDGTGNIYVTGGFTGTVDFDPSVGIFSMTSTGNVDMFITKLTTDGNFVWAKRFGGTGTNTTFVRSVASDGNGVYTTGNFSGTIDFDPNTGTQLRTSAGSTSFSDIFISKLDVNGNFSWAYRLGRSSASDFGRAIAVDATGNVYSAGTFSGTVDFDPGAGTSNLIGGGATDLYIHKLNNAGIFQWARTVGGAGVEIPYTLALDASGNPHLAGTFGTVIANQTVDFDPGAGTFNLVSNQGIIFNLKLTPAGGFIWAKNFGGAFGAEPTDITVDAAGNVLTIGAGQGISSYNPDFDPGTGVYLLKSNVNRDLFVSQLDVNGNFSWAYNLGSTGSSTSNTDGFSIVTDTDGSIYTSGSISHSSDLDPGHCTFPLFYKDGGAFIQKIKPGVAALCFNQQPITAAVCIETPVTFNVAATGTTNITYQWQKLNTGTSLFEDITNTGGYSGATSPTLIINTIGNFGAGSYQCKVRGDNAPDKNSSIATLTVNTPSSPPTVTGSTSCTIAAQTLTASGSTNGNYRWYDVASGGTAIPGEVNSTFTTPPISASTTFFVSILNGTCESPTTPVVAQFTISLSAPTTTGAANCGAAILILNAAGGTSGQYRWYTTATGGTAIAGAVNATYTTPAITTTTTYYVAINNGTCESTRTSVIATISSPPIAPTTTGAGICGNGTVNLTASGGSPGQYVWYSVATGGAAIAGAVNATFTTPALAATTTYYVAINNGTCESTRTAVIATISSPPIAPTTTGAGICGNGTVSLTASGGSPGQYVWYSVATGGTAIAGAVNATYTTPAITTTTTYYVAINNGTCESTRTSVIANISSPPIAPTTTGAGICGNGTVNLTASGGSPGQYVWYSVATGGAAIAGAVNATFTTPALAATTTFYVAINNGTCESPRTAVIATISSPPIAPTTTGAGICGNGTVNLTASGGSPGQYVWYSVATGGTAIAGAVNATYTTPAITNTTTYYVAINNGTCESTRTAVIATISSPPIAPTTTGAGICGNGTVNLTASGGSPGQYLWYSVATGGTAIAGAVNATFTTPAITTTTTYYVAINNGTCESVRTAVTATISAPPAKPTVTSTPSATSGAVAICSNASATLSAPSATSYLWSSGETTQQITVTKAGAYTVVVRSGAGCSSPSSDALTIIVNSCNSEPPVISPSSLVAEMGGKTSLSIPQLISKIENVDLGTLRITKQPTSGANATIDGKLNLVVDYNGISFVGQETLTIQGCNFTAICVEQVITIDVGTVIAYNGISANGDSKNAILLLKYIDVLQDTKRNTVSIYNRWGDRVFQVDDYDNATRAFIGKNQDGADLPADTYFYKIEFASGRKTQTGYLSLKR